jgi:restriction system protein
VAIWLVRAGAHGAFEQKFIDEARVYLTWETLNVDLSKLNREELSATMNTAYPDRNPRTIRNWVSQIWPFAHEMSKGDLIVLPLKLQPSIYIGEIIGDYHPEPQGPDPFFHSRAVKWIGEAIPRSNFGPDLLFSFGAFLTICRIKRNNAESRIAAMRANGWKPEAPSALTSVAALKDDETAEDTDLEELAQDQIQQLILSRFKGHGLTRLVDGILRAQGYSTYVSPEGADGGADILAGAGPLGFGKPRLCVEVKSGDSPIDRPTVDKLLGAVTKFGADQGLFVSMSGFKGNVEKELAGSFFRVRLWSRKELFEQLFQVYERLDDELKAQLPLRRVWMVTGPSSS